MKFLFLWIFIIFLFFVTKSRADEWFYPKVYKGIIFAYIGEKITDAEMDELQLTDTQLKDPEIKFIGCKNQEKETEDETKNESDTSKKRDDDNDNDFMGM